MRITTIRNMDAQGRIVLPSEIRKVLGISEGDPLEIETTGQDIRLRKCAGTRLEDRRLQKYLTILRDAVKHIVFICTETNVHSAKGAFIPDGTAVPPELAAYVRAEKEFHFDPEHPVYVFPHVREAVAAILPLGKPDREPLALVALCRQGEPLMHRQLEIAKLVAALLTRELA